MSTHKKPSVTTVIFGLLCLNAVVMYVDRTNMAIAAPLIQREMGLTNLSLGVAFSSLSIAYAGLCWSAAGWAIHRLAAGPDDLRSDLGRRNAVHRLGRRLADAGLRAFLLGMGEAAVYPISSSVIGRWIPRARRGTAQGVLHGCGRLGAAITPGAVTALILAFSWRSAFLIFGGVSLLVTIIIWAYLRDDPRLHPGITAGELETLGHGADAARSVPILASPPMVWPEFFRRVWPVTAVSFCYGWFSWFLLSWIPLYFTHAHGLNLKHVAALSTLVLIGGVFGMVCGGFATDWWLTRTGSARRGRRDIVIVSFLGATLCILPLLFSINLVIDTAFLALAYFMIELADPSIWMLGMEVLPSHAATSTAMVNTGFAIAGAVSPLVVGWLLDATGGNWTIVFLASIVVMLIGPLLVWRIKFNIETTELHGASVLQNVP